MRFRYSQLEIINKLSRVIHHESDNQEYTLHIRYPDSVETVKHTARVTDIGIAQAMHHCIAGELTDRGFFIEGIEHYTRQDIMQA